MSGIKRSAEPIVTRSKRAKLDAEQKVNESEQANNELNECWMSIMGMTDSAVASIEEQLEALQGDSTHKVLDTSLTAYYDAIAKDQEPWEKCGSDPLIR